MTLPQLRDSLLSSTKLETRKKVVAYLTHQGKMNLLSGFNKNGHVLGKPTVSDSISSLNSRKVKIVERIAELY